MSTIERSVGSAAPRPASGKRSALEAGNAFAGATRAEPVDLQTAALLALEGVGPTLLTGQEQEMLEAARRAHALARRVGGPIQHVANALLAVALAATGNQQRARCMFQDELRTLDEESRRVRTAVAGTLTAQELRIAQTVAGGATNKEVAARLFLSVKTVEVHLGHIYAKLGIHSRTELVALLLRPDEFPSGGPGTVDGRTWDPLVAAQ